MSTRDYPMNFLYGKIYCAGLCGRTYRKVETKKERIARIAKEKMYSSWKIYNQRTVNIIEAIPIYKPFYHPKYLPNNLT